MSSIKRSRRFFSMPIVSVEEGQQLGYVKNLVVNAATLEVVALLVEPKGFFKEQKVIPYTRVKSIGEDAIVIEKSSSAEKPANLPQIMQLIKEKIDLVGTKVIDETGSSLGVVEEFLIEPTNGKIISFEIGGKFLDSISKGKSYLPAEQIKTVGKDVLIAKAESEFTLTKVESNLPETFKNLKEGSSHLLETTLRKSKDLSQTISKSWPVKRGGKADTNEIQQPIETKDVSELPVQETKEIPAEDHKDEPPAQKELLEITPPVEEAILPKITDIKTEDEKTEDIKKA